MVGPASDRRTQKRIQMASALYPIDGRLKDLSVRVIAQPPPTSRPFYEKKRNHSRHTVNGCALQAPGVLTPTESSRFIPSERALERQTTILTIKGSYHCPPVFVPVWSALV